MLIVQRLIYKQIFLYAVLLSLGITFLFVFFILPEEISSVTPDSGYSILKASIYSILTSLVNLQDIVPIAVLIAAVYVLSKMAINSEFTILRTSGLGPVGMLKILIVLGVFFTFFSFILSNYVSPSLENFAEEYKLKSKGLNELNAKNLIWLKSSSSQTATDYIINLKTVDFANVIHEINIFSFNKQGFLTNQITAETAVINKNTWQLADVSITSYSLDDSANAVNIRKQSLAKYIWPSNISLLLVKSSFSSPNKMSIFDLYRYANYLTNNKQDAQSYQIAFWSKIFASLSTTVMLLLALPFAYLHFRNSNVYFYVFVGIVIGLSFFMSNTISQHLSRINHWTPWVTTMTPSLIYSIISLIMFYWLIRNR